MAISYIGVKKNVCFDIFIDKKESELATYKTERSKVKSILFQSLRHKKRPAYR